MQDFQKGGEGRKFRKFENNKDQTEHFLAQNQVRFPTQNWVKTKKKRSSLKFSPVFGLKLGEGQKKGLCPPFLCSNPRPNLQRKGPCCNFAYYFMLIILSWRPKGGAWPNGPLNTPLSIRVSYFRFYMNITRGLKAKSMRVCKVRPIAYDWIGVVSVLLNPTVLEIFYFKHNFGTSCVRHCNNFYWQH